MISISNIFQNRKYCFFLLTVLPNTGVLKLSSSVVFVDCSFCSCSTGRLLRELLGPAACVATLLSASRSKVTATVLLSVSSFLLLALSFFVFLTFVRFCRCHCCCRCRCHLTHCAWMTEDWHLLATFMFLPWSS